MSFFSKIQQMFKSSPFVDFLTAEIPYVAKAELKGEILTLTYSDGVVGQYHGDCTCWNRYPDMESVNVFMESELHRYWKYNKVHGKPYINPKSLGPKS